MTCYNTYIKCKYGENTKMKSIDKMVVKGRKKVNGHVNVR